MKAKGNSASMFRTLAVAGLIVLASLVTVKAQTTGFTYQGQLSDGASPANGAYQMRFALFDAATGGTQEGATVTIDGAVGNAGPVQVAGGIFTVVLDFGSLVFGGGTRFLEISIKKTTDPLYTTLAPRQALTSAPYSVRAVTAGTAETAFDADRLGGVTAGNYVQTGDARLSDARAPSPGSSNYVQNQSAAPQTATNFNISGSGVAGLSLSANVVNATVQYNLGGARILSGDFSNNFFAGLHAGASTDTGSNNTFVGTNAAFNNASGDFNLMAGVSAGFANTTGSNNTALGALADFAANNLTFATAVGAGAKVTASNTVALGRSADTVSIPGSLSLAGTFSLGGFRILSAPGAANLFAGQNAGAVNTGAGNSFVGAGAGSSNTSGGGNSFLGNSAGQANTTGIRNSFVGAKAGLATTTGGANTFFGESAGATNLDGGNNTVVGAGADVTAGNLSFATAIGAGATVTKSNTIALGRADGSDLVQVFRLGAGGSTQLCRNSANEISGCSSSMRYKTNIASYTSGLSLVRRLRPITFDWKTDGMKDLGFGAEEVAAVNPLLVTYNGQGQVEGVKYDRLSVLFVNAFKEQQAQIENQQQQLAEQKKLIDGLRQLVCAQNPQADLCH